MARTPPSNNSECNDGEKSRLNFEQLDANTIMFKEAYNKKFKSTCKLGGHPSYG